MEPDGIKSVPFKVKAAGPDDGLSEGQFEGYASVFGNIDSYGDVVVKGAFQKTLAEWREKGDPIPLLWAHDTYDPFSNIGGIDAAEEDDHGLRVRGTFDLENAKAAQVYKLAKGRRVTDMSFAYETRDEERRDDANYLKELHLYEASIVPIGANPLAGVEVVKSAAAGLTRAVKAGRVLSAKNESALREARDAIDSVLLSLGDDGDGKAARLGGNNQEPKASGTSEAKPGASDEEPVAAKSSVPGDEPKPDPSVDAVLAVISIAEKGI